MSQVKNQSVGEPKAPDRFRFQLWHLFYLTALIAVGIVVAGVWSLPISSVTFVSWWLWHTGRRQKLLIAIAVVGISVGMMLPPVTSSLGTPNWATCLNNMRYCVLAMLYYELENGHLPPVWEEDDEGKPMHSWRVLILPYLGEEELYNKYDFEEPWDGPNNSKLVDQMPNEYRCGWGPESVGKTTFKLVSDKEALFYGPLKRSIKEAIDGTATGIVVVEDSDNPVNWMKPEGLAIEDAVSIIANDRAGHCAQRETIYTKALFFRNVTTLDGASYRTTANADSELLRQSMRFADGLSPDPSGFFHGGVIYKPSGFIALALYVFLLALQGWLLRKRSAV